MSFKDNLQKSNAIIPSIEYEKHKILMLKEESQKIAKTFDENIQILKELKGQKNKLEVLRKELTKENVKLYEEKHNLQKKHGLAQNETVQEIVKNIENLYSCLGYRIVEFKTIREHVKQVTLQYNNYDCFIKFHLDERYELVEMSPEHPNFLEIKQFSQKTQDVRGLLATFRKFCNAIINLQIKQEKQIE